MNELLPATNMAATEYITMETMAIRWRTRKAALNATTESSSSRRCMRPAVPNALMRRMPPKLSWMVDVTSDVAARYTSVLVRIRGMAHCAQSSAGATSTPAARPSHGFRSVTSATQL